MPVLGTMGAASARNYGLFGRIKAAPTGSMGVFSRGASLTSIYSYQWANDVVTQYTPLSVSPAGSTAGASNSVMGIMLVGSTSQPTFNNKILWSNNTIGRGTNLTAGYRAGNGSGGCGNADKGMFFRGDNTNSTQQYVYAGDLTGVGGTLTRNSIYGYAAGNATFCIVAIGGPSVFSNSYTYASDAAAVATSFTISMAQSGAMGTADVGIFCRASTTQVYNYAANTAVVGGALSTVATYGQGAGNEVFGIMIGSGSSACNKYTYSSNTCVLGTAIPGTSAIAAVANGLVGVTA